MPDSLGNLGVEGPCIWLSHIKISHSSSRRVGSFLDDILTLQSVHRTPGSVTAYSSSETCPPPVSVTKLISPPDKPNPPNTSDIKRQNIHTVRGVRHIHWTPSLMCPKQNKANIKQPGVQEDIFSISGDWIYNHIQSPPCLPRCQDFPEQLADQYCLEQQSTISQQCLLPLCFSLQICSGHSLGNPRASKFTKLLAPYRTVCPWASKLWYCLAPVHD